MVNRLSIKHTKVEWMQDARLKDMLEKHHKEAFTWAMKCCDHNLENTHETMQNTYLKILEGKAKYNGTATFKTWLFSIIRNTAIDLYRKRSRNELMVVKRGEVIENLGGMAEIEEKIEKNEIKQMLQKALETLSEKQQEVLHLVFYHSLSINDAATIMEISIGSARTHYERGKKHLRKLLIKANSNF